jgi:dUTP pyrophosphatase
MGFWDKKKGETIDNIEENREIEQPKGVVNKPLNINFKKLREGMKLPKKAHNDDACFDVEVCKIEELEGGNLVVCYLGFSTEIAEGYKGVIVPRSSITKFGWVMQNSPAQIDAGYRGEWIVKFRPLPMQSVVDGHKVTNHVYSHKFPYDLGDRVAQIYFEKVLDVKINLVDEITDSERGKGGFGSTNKN